MNKNWCWRCQFL